MLHAVSERPNPARRGYGVGGRAAPSPGCCLVYALPAGTAHVAVHGTHAWHAEAGRAVARAARLDDGRVEAAWEQLDEAGELLAVGAVTRDGASVYPEQEVACRCLHSVWPGVPLPPQRVAAQRRGHVY